MTVDEMAAALRVSPQTIKRRIHAGEINAELIKIHEWGSGGARFEIPSEELTRLLRPVEPDLDPLPDYPVRPWK